MSDISHILTFSIPDEAITKALDKKTYNIRDGDDNAKGNDMNISFVQCEFGFYVSSIYNDTITAKIIKILLDKIIPNHDSVEYLISTPCSIHRIRNN